VDKNDAVYPIEGFTSGMNAQAYAAIHLKVTSPDLPDWLNEMIDRSRMDDFMRSAPSAEINEIMPSTVGKCAEFLGVTVDEFMEDRGAYYSELLAKLRAVWANSMMEESK